MQTELHLYSIDYPDLKASLAYPSRYDQAKNIGSDGCAILT